MKCIGHGAMKNISELQYVSLNQRTLYEGFIEVKIINSVTVVTDRYSLSTAWASLGSTCMEMI